LRVGRLTHEQAAAVRLVAARGISVLTGGPGTGKTHTLKSVMEACAALGLDVQVVAPTGRRRRALPR
jgi:ATP-dependent exoDNAse (exonuclease V) alpha subunit